MGAERRQKILIGVLLVVALAAIARFTVFSGDDDNDDAATTSSRPNVTVPIDGDTSTTLDPNAIPPVDGEIDIFGGKNPFEPAIIIAPPTTPTTSTTVPSGSTSSTTPGATTSTTTPSNDPNNQTFTLLTITRQTNGTYVATARIGSTQYPDILEGTTFGPGNTYRFVRGTNDNCGTFQHGDNSFDLCENTSTNK